MRPGQRHQVALVVAACCLLASCQHHSKDQAHEYRPKPEMEASMLSIEDVPGATTVSWGIGVGGAVATNCPGVEYISSPPSRDHVRTASSARFTLGEVIVTQTATFDIAEGDHGEDTRTLDRYLRKCDGQTFPAIVHVPDSHSSDSESTETLVLTPPSELPTGTLGFRSRITAEDGTTLTIERLYAPVTTEGHTPGLIVLTTHAPGDQPGTPTPLDLLDKALTRASATLDPTALNPSTPAPQQTQPPPATTPTTP